MCHRLGVPRDGQTRDIIVRLLYFQDKIEILQRRSLLPKGIYVNEDYAAETKRHIDTLRPVLKEALKTDKQAKMIRDRLVYKNKTYTIDTIKTIPIDLEKLSEKQTNTVTAFAGRYSALSNLHPFSLEIDNQQFNSSEHFHSNNAR